MSHTITKPVHHTVVLGAGGYGNAVLLTSTGTIVPAMSATALIAPDTLGSAFITNDGLVKGGTGGRDAAAGGIGIDFASAAGSITNAGLIVGGHGGYTTGQYGGAGGIGLLGTGAPSIGNSGMIVGGAGGLALAEYATSGTGGVGVSLSAGAITNTGLIKGGHGGGNYHGFDGGYGGNGASLSTGASLQNMASILGGAGGVGSYIGGGGGIGLMLGNGAGAVSNSGLIAGGHGGAEGQDGSGGVGGVGVVLGSGDAVTSNGTILGGTGGYGFSAGYGGDGVNLDGGMLVSSGLISGGADAGYDTIGASGVRINGGTLVNSGTIVAGGSGPYGSPGDAVSFGANGGLAVLEADARIDGRFGGWAAGDTIDVKTVHATLLAYQSGTLSLLNAQHDTLYSLTFDGSYTSTDFALKSDGLGGTDVIFGSGAPAPDFLMSMKSVEAVSTVFQAEAARDVAVLKDWGFGGATTALDSWHVYSRQL